MKGGKVEPARTPRPAIAAFKGTHRTILHAPYVLMALTWASPFSICAGRNSEARATKITTDKTRYYLGEHISHRGIHLKSSHCRAPGIICIAIRKIILPRSFSSNDDLKGNIISLSRRFYCVESDEQCLKSRFRGGFQISTINIKTSKQSQTSAVYAPISLAGDGYDRLYEHHTTGVLAKEMVYRWRRKDYFYNYLSLSRASPNWETPLIMGHQYGLYDDRMLYDNSRVRIDFERDLYWVVPEVVVGKLSQ